MSQIYMRRYGMQTITSDSDGALVSWPIPAKCTLNYLKGEVHVLPVAPVDVADITIYDLQAWILLTDDSSDFNDMDTLWNNKVPKDEDATVTPVNEDETSTEPVADLGLVNASQIIQYEIHNHERIYNKQEMLSLAKNPTGFVPGSPDTFYPTGLAPISVMKKYHMRNNAGLVMGLSSPGFDEISADNNIINITAVGTHYDAFYIMRFIDDFLDYAVITLLGQHEPGAESPYDNMLDFTLFLLEQVNHTATTGAYTAINYTGAAKITAGVRVPGKLEAQTLGPDMQAT